MNLEDVLFLAVILIAMIGAVSALAVLFSKRKPRRGGFVASLPTQRVQPAIESEEDYNRRTNHGYF